jgi:hypothetical protein
MSLVARDDAKAETKKMLLDGSFLDTKQDGGVEHGIMYCLFEEKWGRLAGRTVLGILPC